MPKRRVSSPQRAPRRPSGLTQERHRFIGLALGGAKADRAAIAVMEYFPQHHKIFLSQVFDKIRNDENLSADTKIHELIEQYRDSTELIALDGPWRFPVSLREPAGEGNDDHIQWANEHLRQASKAKRPKRIFAPYTQRAVELWVASELDEPFALNQAMGANQAPLLARASYLTRRWKAPMVEVSTKIALWRIGRSLQVMKSHLRRHRNSVGGLESRRALLESLAQNRLAFMYEQDVRLMAESPQAFEAFVCAFTAFLAYKGWTEPRPEDFPEQEDWLEIPIEKIPWKEI